MVRFPLLFLILLTAFGLPRGAGAQGVFDFEPDTLFHTDSGEVVMTNVLPDTVILDSMSIHWGDGNVGHAWIVHAVGQPTGGELESYEFTSPNSDAQTANLTFALDDTLSLSFNFDSCGLCAALDRDLTQEDTLSSVDTLLFHANGLIATDTLVIDWSFPVADERGPAATPNLELAVHPNPASGHAEITMNVESSGITTVSVFDSRGRRISELHHGALAAGRHVLVWDGSEVTPGVYLIHAETEEASVSRPVTITR